MKTKNIIDKLTKNIVFKEIEEEAYNFYKKDYKESPLELLFSSKKDSLYGSMLSSESFNKSITIYHCLLKIRSTYNSFKILEIDDKNEKEAFKSNSKYIDYLYYNKEFIEIDKLHKLLSTNNFSIEYSDIFNYFILNKLYDQNSYKKLSEFIIFLIAKLDDLKIPFCKKWGPILSTFNNMSLTYFNKQYDNFVDALNLAHKATVKNKSNKVKFTHNININNNFNIPAQSNTYSNMFTKCGPLTPIAINLDSWKIDNNKEANEFFISIIKAFITYIYNLISLKNKQYEFFKYLIENDFLFRSVKKYKRYFYNTKIGTLSSLSNFDAIKNGLNAHKSNLKIIKTYLKEFDINLLEEMRGEGDVLTYIIFNDYYNDFNDFFNKYLEKVKKITIRT